MVKKKIINFNFFSHFFFIDISKLGNEYKEEYMISDLKVKETIKRGFHFSIPKTSKLDPNEIIEFVQINLKGKFYKFSSEKLLSLNTRFKECVNEILLLTGRVIEDLVIEIKKHLSIIYLLSDTVAMYKFFFCFIFYIFIFYIFILYFLFLFLYFFFNFIFYFYLKKLFSLDMIVSFANYVINTQRCGTQF